MSGLIDAAWPYHVIGAIAIIGASLYFTATAGGANPFTKG